jgi:hypothetical protein
VDYFQTRFYGENILINLICNLTAVKGKKSQEKPVIIISLLLSCIYEHIIGIPVLQKVLN